MKKVLFVSALLSLLSFNHTIAQIDFSTAHTATDKIMDEITNREDIVGSSITIGLGDSIVYTKGYGLMDKDNKIKAQSFHKFRIYSLSKHITAIAIAKLYEEGKIDLDTSIKTYLPFIDDKLKSITTRQLVGHLSGVRSYAEGEWQIFANSTCANPHEAMMVFQSDSLLFVPGEKYQYTTYGYVVLSAIIEKVSGMPFLDYLNEALFHPIGINNITLDNPEITDYLAAKPYEYYKEVMYNARYANNTCKFGGGGLSASTLDLVYFNQALLHRKIISAETLDLVFSEMKLNNGKQSDYGFGFQLETDKKGRFLAWHSGRSRGGRNALILYPKIGLIVCISANTNGEGIVNEAEAIANHYLDLLLDG